MMTELDKYQGNPHVTVDHSSNHFNFGQYYRYQPTDADTISDQLSLFKEGEIYPIVGMGIHHISQTVHNVTLFIPLHLRSDSKGVEQLRLNVKDVERHFSLVDSDVAEKERQGLLDDYQAQVKSIEHDLKTALKSPQEIMQKVMTEKNAAVREACAKLDTSIPLLPSPAQMASPSSGIVPTSNGTSLDVLKRQLMNQQQLGNIVTVYAREKKTELSTTMEYVMSIKSEQSHAVAGQAAQMMQSVGDVESKLEQLSLYMGDGVSLSLICDGPESSSRAKVHLFSHLIYVDEEMLTHSIFNNGEFDHHNISAFFEHLRQDVSFRDRIFPTERCIVVARPRRNTKFYNQCPFTNEKLNAPNFSTFILIRDGERIHAVYSSINSQHRMFPTPAEMDRYFSHIADVDDVRLTAAQRGLKSLNEQYTKVAAILQGIVDRQETGGEVVFGPLPLHAYSSSFFNPSSIAENIEFVNDEDYLLGSDGPLSDVSGWLNQHFVSSHCENDLVFMNDHMFSEKRTPQAWSNGVYPEQQWEQNEAGYAQLKRVSMRNDCPSLRCEAINITRGKKHGTTKSLYVDISDATLLSIKKLTLSDLNLVIGSRVARPTLNDYRCMPALLTARKCISEAMTYHAELIQALVTQRPALSVDEAYLAVLSHVMDKKIDLLSPLANKPALMRRLCEIADGRLTSYESLMELDVPAYCSQQKPVALARTLTSIVLITDDSDALIRNVPFHNAWELKAKPIFTGLKLHEWAPDKGFTDLGYASLSTLRGLDNLFFYPLVELPPEQPRFNPLKEIQPLPEIESYRLATQQAFERSIVSSSSLKHAIEFFFDEQHHQQNAMIGDWINRVTKALDGDDEARVRVFDELLLFIGFHDSLEERFSSKNKEVLLPRFCSPIGVQARPEFKNRYPVFDVTTLWFHPFRALAVLAGRVKGEALTNRLIHFLRDSFYYKDSFSIECVSGWAGEAYLHIASTSVSSFDSERIHFNYGSITWDVDTLQAHAIQLPRFLLEQ